MSDVRPSSVQDDTFAAWTAPWDSLLQMQQRWWAQWTEGVQLWTSWWFTPLTPLTAAATDWQPIAERVVQNAADASAAAEEASEEVPVPPVPLPSTSRSRGQPRPH